MQNFCSHFRRQNSNANPFYFQLQRASLFLTSGGFLQSLTLWTCSGLLMWIKGPSSPQVPKVTHQSARKTSVFYFIFGFHSSTIWNDYIRFPQTYQTWQKNPFIKIIFFCYNKNHIKLTTLTILTVWFITDKYGYIFAEWTSTIFWSC